MTLMLNIEFPVRWFNSTEGQLYNDCGLLPDINNTGLRYMYMRKVPCSSRSVVLYNKLKEGAIDKRGKC